MCYNNMKTSKIRGICLLFCYMFIWWPVALTTCSLWFAFVMHLKRVMVYLYALFSSLYFYYFFFHFNTITTPKTNTICLSFLPGLASCQSNESESNFKSTTERENMSSHTTYYIARVFFLSLFHSHTQQPSNTACCNGFKYATLQSSRSVSQAKQERKKSTQTKFRLQ